MEAKQIDESLYSRQLYVMGHDAQRRMGAADVLIIGLDGLGVEVAKNVILAGVKSVTLHDDSPASSFDLASQFYLSEKDIGTPRAHACSSKLAELNPYVEVTTHSSPIDEAFLKQFRVVVMLNATQPEALRINQVCHANDIAFISSAARGVFGQAFCDFGDKFVVSDVDGEQPVDCMITSISNTSPPVVTVSDDTRHGLETGNFVTFREVDAMPFLNECEPRRITVTGPFTFTLDPLDDADTQRFEACEPATSGYLTQVKMPQEFSFQPLSKAQTSPGDFLLSDFSKIGRSELLHVAFQALQAFQIENDDKLPRAGSLEDANHVFKLACELNSSAKDKGQFHVDDLESNASRDIVLALALGAQGSIAPMTAYFGGLVGQETIKACSGKFTPLHQFMYFDAFEALPDYVLSSDKREEFMVHGDRYDSQVAVFGQTLQKKMMDQRLFLVGAGAIGCEMLKNWALMGVGAGVNGQIHLTDMDAIEKSNLNRQFLFRAKDVGRSKSVAAAEAIQAMNPQTKVKSYESRVGADSESLFNDEFFESLSGVCTALDNVDARLYMDQKCMFYGLPMFESGTLGTKGNTQVVVPHKTENYGASRDPPEKSIPLCTLKNFPNAIEHTLQWARDWFEGEFFQTAADVNHYLDSDNYKTILSDQPNTKVETVDRLKKSLVNDRPATFEDCIKWARFRFDDLFCSQLKQLLHNFPLDKKTTTGAPFWSGPKRPPTPIEFDVNDPLHLDFITSTANARAKMYGLESSMETKEIANVVSKVHVEPFVPSDNVKIAASDAEMESQTSQSTDNPDAHVDATLASLPPKSQVTPLNPITFDKDDDAHMSVIVATSNLRARAYRIQEADMHKSRFIAGKIIPAIATTTALVTGLVCVELVKVIQEKPLESYKNAFANLALPLFALSEPIEPKKTTTKLKGEDYVWTAWDSLEVKGGHDMTLKQFLSYLEKEYDAEVTMLSYGVTILYAMYSAKSKSKERMNMSVPELVETVTKKPLDKNLKYLVLELCAMDADAEDIELPYIRYHLHP